jgi:hypothetical protein
MALCSVTKSPSSPNPSTADSPALPVTGIYMRSRRAYPAGIGVCVPSGEFFEAAIGAERMIPNIEVLYERIADAMISSIPEDWATARIVAIFYADSITWEPEFQPRTGGLKSFDVSMELTRAFEELRRKFKEAGKPVWGQAIFDLKPDGKFNMKWGYDNCDENGDTVWDEEEWLRRQEARRQRLSQR